jgi:23S rRNA pseudouridine2605 synthase
MRINKYVALATGISRRAADDLIAESSVLVNKQPVQIGQEISENDTVALNGKTLVLPISFTTIVLHKPKGYVCSRNGQGSTTIYDLLPEQLYSLKPVGRLDKDSSGLLLLTNDGALANALTHPSKQKIKVYEIILDRPLNKLDWQSIHEQGIQLEDGLSTLFLERIEPFDNKQWQVTMHEGRNRQIRRTFAALGYTVESLHRIQFGPYKLKNLPEGTYSSIPTSSKSG